MKELNTESSDKVQDVRDAISRIHELAEREARRNYQKIKLDKNFIDKCLDFFNQLTGIKYSNLEKEWIYYWLNVD